MFDKKILAIFCSSISLMQTVYAKNIPYEMDAISVTQSRIDAATVKDAHTIRSIDRVTLNHKTPRNLPEALDHVPGVLVQKTAHGQGSPFIRGFTGYRTLVLIDGVRYNNSVYRDGPNEYFSLIDINTINKIDLYSGPASALFGSDAIGGTLNLQTQSADFLNRTPHHFFFAANEKLRYSTAEHSFGSRTEFDFGVGQHWGIKTGFSRRNFGDIDAAELGRLDKTSYDEYAFDIRLDWLVNDHWDITLNHQNLKQDDVWRTHSTLYSKSFAGTEVGTDRRRLKDQYREMTYAKLRGYDLHPLISQATLTVSHQRWQEQGDRIRSNGKRMIEIFDSAMSGIDLQLETEFDSIRLAYGLDYYLDRVDSGRTDFLASGNIDRVRIQGPIGDDAEFGLFGAYIKAKWDMTERLHLNVSSRYSYVDADIGRYEDPDTGTAASFGDHWTDVSHAIKASYDVTDNHIIWGGISQAFRAPNIADLSRFGGSRSNETEIAATGLSPELFMTYEIGYRFNNDRTQFQASYFYTEIDDFITSTPTGNIVGGLTEVSKQNSAEGFIHGIELNLDYFFHPQLSSNINMTWLEGRLKRTDTVNSANMITEPFSRIMPLTAHISLDWVSLDHRSQVGAEVTLSAKADKLSEGDRNDLQRIPRGGTPSYQLFNLYTSYDFTPKFSAGLRLNNLFDEAYRTHGSGSNEVGRNAIITTTLRF